MNTLSAKVGNYPASNISVKSMVFENEVGGGGGDKKHGPPGVQKKKRRGKTRKR